MLTAEQPFAACGKLDMHIQGNATLAQGEAHVR
jgi:hypothetical protein